MTQKINKTSKIKDTAGDRVYIIIVHTVLVLCTLACVLPVLHVISESFSSSSAIIRQKVFFWPVEICVDSYKLMLQNSRVITALVNSVVITAVGVVLQTIGTTMASYPLSKPYMYGRRAFSLLFVFARIFASGMIPLYLLTAQLGLLNSYWSIWLPGLVSVYNTMILRTQFESVPAEIYESARIDGAGEWRIMLQMYVPLSKATYAALILFSIVDYWNTFRNILLYISDSSRHNLAVYVQNMIDQQKALTELNANADIMDAGIDTVEKGVQAAGIVVLILPIFILYPFLQRYFTKGVMIGAIKG